MPTVTTKIHEQNTYVEVYPTLTKDRPVTVQNGYDTYIDVFLSPTQPPLDGEGQIQNGHTLEPQQAYAFYGITGDKVWAKTTGELAEVTVT